MKKFSRKWWKEWFFKASIRALYTFAQGLVGMTLVEASNLLNLDWGKILLTCFIMAIVSYFKSFIIGLPELQNE